MGGGASLYVPTTLPARLPPPPPPPQLFVGIILVHLSRVRGLAMLTESQRNWDAVRRFIISFAPTSERDLVSRVNHEATKNWIQALERRSQRKEAEARRQKAAIKAAIAERRAAAKAARQNKHAAAAGTEAGPPASGAPLALLAPSPHPLESKTTVAHRAGDADAVGPTSPAPSLSDSAAAVNMMSNRERRRSVVRGSASAAPGVMSRAIGAAAVTAPGATTTVWPGGSSDAGGSDALRRAHTLQPAGGGGRGGRRAVTEDMRSPSNRAGRRASIVAGPRARRTSLVALREQAVGQHLILEDDFAATPAAQMLAGTMDADLRQLRRAQHTVSLDTLRLLSVGGLAREVSIMRDVLKMKLQADTAAARATSRGRALSRGKSMAGKVPGTARSAATSARGAGGGASSVGRMPAAPGRGVTAPSELAHGVDARMHAWSGPALVGGGGASAGVAAAPAPAPAPTAVDVTRVVQAGAAARAAVRRFSAPAMDGNHDAERLAAGVAVDVDVDGGPGPGVGTAGPYGGATAVLRADSPLELRGGGSGGGGGGSASNRAAGGVDRRALPARARRYSAADPNPASRPTVIPLGPSRAARTSAGLPGAVVGGPPVPGTVESPFARDGASSAARFRDGRSRVGDNATSLFAAAAEQVPLGSPDTLASPGAGGGDAHAAFPASGETDLLGLRRSSSRDTLASHGTHASAVSNVSAAVGAGPGRTRRASPQPNPERDVGTGMPPEATVRRDSASAPVPALPLHTVPHGEVTPSRPGSKAAVQAAAAFAMSLDHKRGVAAGFPRGDDDVVSSPGGGDVASDAGDELEEDVGPPACCDVGSCGVCAMCGCAACCAAADGSTPICCDSRLNGCQQCAAGRCKPGCVRCCAVTLLCCEATFLCCCWDATTAAAGGDGSRTGRSGAGASPSRAARGLVKALSRRRMRHEGTLSPSVLPACRWLADAASWLSRACYDIAVPCNENTSACAHGGRRRWHFLHRRFDNIMMGFILLNTVVLMLNHDPITPTFAEGLAWTNFGFLVVFTVELLIKLGGMGVLGYARDRWNLFDALVVVSSWIMTFAQIPGGVQVARVFRVARLTRLLRQAPTLRVVFTTMIVSLGSLANTTLVMVLFIYVFGVVSIELYGPLNAAKAAATAWAAATPAVADVFPLSLSLLANSTVVSNATLWLEANQPLEGIHRHAQFRNIGRAMLTLFRTVTGENWVAIYHDTWNYSRWAPLFWIR